MNPKEMLDRLKAKQAAAELSMNVDVAAPEVAAEDNVQPAPWAYVATADRPGCKACKGSGWQSQQPAPGEAPPVPCRICLTVAKGLPMPNECHLGWHNGYPSALLQRETVPVVEEEEVNGSLPPEEDMELEAEPEEVVSAPAPPSMPKKPNLDPPSKVVTRIMPRVRRTKDEVAKGLTVEMVQQLQALGKRGEPAAEQAVLGDTHGDEQGAVTPEMQAAAKPDDVGAPDLGICREPDNLLGLIVVIGANVLNNGSLNVAYLGRELLDGSFGAAVAKELGEERYYECNPYERRERLCTLAPSLVRGLRRDTILVVDTGNVEQREVGQIFLSLADVVIA